MRNSIIVCLMTLLSSVFLQAQNLDEVLNNYFEANGQEKYNRLETVVMKGVSIAQGMENDIVIMQKRPDKLRVEVDIQGMKMIQAYDGNKGWIIAPWAGSTDPVELSGFQLSMVKTQADFEGPLYNWKEKGHKAELLDREDLEGTEVDVVKLELKDGDVNTYYIDSENHVLLKMDSKTMDGSETVESETYFGNYKEENGMLIPFSIENRMNGQMISQVTVSSMEFETELEDSIFVMPEPEED